LSGTKIFISGGEHDLTDNIVHLVLARLPDAPPGPKGLSLFLVPKFYPDGSRSAAHCERIEEKMGLHGSPTCVMRFDAARAWMVGEPGKGLNAMFIMMNSARLHVAMQGMGLLDAAWRKADAYARERRQMRAPGGGKTAGQADLIGEHPAVRRILDTQRAWIDGGRVLAYRTALELDLAKHHEDPERRAQAQRWCSLITPVLKSAWSEQGFLGASACLQVFGGHGYVSEWGIEQIVRDARVTMIYEGTNEVQAIDLLVRKVISDRGQALGLLLDQLLQEQADTGLRQCGERLRQISERLCQSHDASLPYAVADDYLRAVALVLLEWAWAKLLSAPQSQKGSRWLLAAGALRRHILPEFEMRLNMIELRLEETTALA
jgi:alkylation response protein AidB-like acyl-CoA dehydrogenase